MELPLEAVEFLTWLRVEKGRAPNTLAAYRRDLVRYVEHLRGAGIGIAAVTTEDLAGYITRLRDEGLADSSVTRALVSVRSLHRFLVVEGLVPGPDPGADVDLPKVPAGLPKALSVEEVDRLLATFAGTAAHQRRDRAMVETLYGTGMRISELVGLSLSDLDLGGSLIRCFGKGRKERIVPVGRFALEALEEWLAPEGRLEMSPEHWRDRSDAEAVFLNQRGGRLTRQGAWGVLRSYSRRAGLDHKMSPHVLRHSCATHMLNNGADIRSVQELLGHASITTTQVYTRVSSDRLWQVYRDAHPRAQLSPAR